MEDIHYNSMDNVNTIQNIDDIVKEHYFSTFDACINNEGKEEEGERQLLMNKIEVSEDDDEDDEEDNKIVNSEDNIVSTNNNSIDNTNTNPDSNVNIKEEPEEPVISDKWTLLPTDKWISANPIAFKEDYVKNIPQNVKTPYEFFSLFFSESYNKELASFTNKYAAFRKKKYFDNISKNLEQSELQLTLKWRDINETDIEKFIASYIIFGLYKLPTLQDHFSTQSMIKSPATELTSAWRNKIMSSFFHASECDAKRKDKIMPAIRHIMSISQKYYYPSTGVSIDERMVSYQGRSDYLYYCQAKPTKWGFKPYVLADYKSGYTYGMNVLENIDTSEDGKMYNLVKGLMNDLKENNKSNYSPHILATDGLYSSEKLLLEDDFKFIGAIRPGRIKSNHRQIMKSIKRGTFEYYYKYENDDFQVLTKYMDSKLLFLISNFIDTNRLCTKSRWSRKLQQYIEISFPEIVKVYQILMKGVDISNQLISYYEIDIRMKKWWKRLFNHLIDIAVVNSYILYNKSGRGEVLSQKKFRESIVLSVIAKYKVEQISKELACEHLIRRTNKQRTCKGCYEKKYHNAKNTPTTIYMCIACEIHLCPTCFYDYHQKFIEKYNV